MTFRLADSLPQSKLDELVALRREWLERNPLPQSREALEQLSRAMAERTERWLDLGMGSCVLKEPSSAASLTEAMHHFDGDRYELDAYVVMPNHAHVVVRPLFHREHPLGEIPGKLETIQFEKYPRANGRRG